jgi:TRAP-type mannitol/chloroaromatic compound transport system substrate-binding protein
MRKKTVFSALLLLALITAGFAPAHAAKKIVWRAQSSYAAGLPQLYAPAAHFAKLVGELTGGFHSPLKADI